MLDALREFPGLPHRAAWVADVRGVRYVNDSKGTNVGATLAAVAGFAGPLLLIVGGDGKNQDFTPLRAAFAGKVRHALLIGRDAPAIAAALDGCVRAHALRFARSRGGRGRPRCAARATRCCCRPPAPASTCSATTAIAATCSPMP